MTQKERLFTTEAALQMECEGLKNLISKKDKKISYYEEKVERLYEIIRELK